MTITDRHTLAPKDWGVFCLHNNQNLPPASDNRVRKDVRDSRVNTQSPSMNPMAWNPSQFRRGYSAVRLAAEAKTYFPQNVVKHMVLVIAVVNTLYVKQGCVISKTNPSIASSAPSKTQQAVDAQSSHIPQPLKTTRILDLNSSPSA